MASARAKARTLALGVIVLSLCAALVPATSGASERDFHPTSTPLAISTSAPPATNGVVLSPDQVVEALAAEGVGVYTSASASSPIRAVSAPVVPIRVLWSQAVNYAAETAAHSGTSGSEISAVVPMPSSSAGGVYPGFDYLLAAYVTKRSTPGEVLAGRLLGDQDWAQPGTIVFPDLVLTLFSADAVRAALRGKERTNLALGAKMAASGRSSLCATLSNWVSSGFASVFSALTVGPSSNALLNFLGGLWNGAVTLAKQSIASVAALLTDRVIAVVRQSLATIGLVGWAVSALRNLQISSLADPAYNSFGVEPAPGQSGKVTLTVGSTGGPVWPPAISQCAADLNLTLPSLNSIVGGKVTWTIVQKHGTPVTSWCSEDNSCDLAYQNDQTTTSSLSADHQVILGYTTNTETLDQATRGELISNDYILISASVSLNTAKLQALVKGVVLGTVPGAVRVLVAPMLSSLTDSVLAQIASLAQPHFFRYVRIEHHAVPPLLGQISCGSLFSTNDFKGTTVSDVTSVPSPDAYVTVCTYQVPDTYNGPLATVTLGVYKSVGDADAAFTDLVSEDHLGLVPGLGEQGGLAMVGGSNGGWLGAVQVGNDVLSIGSNTGPVAPLLYRGVATLCPDCRS